MIKKIFFNSVFTFLLLLVFMPSAQAVGETCTTNANCCTPPQIIQDGGGCPTGTFWIGSATGGSCQASTLTCTTSFSCNTGACTPAPVPAGTAKCPGQFHIGGDVCVDVLKMIKRAGTPKVIEAWLGSTLGHLVHVPDSSACKDGEVPSWDASNGEWKCAAGGGGSSFWFAGKTAGDIYRNGRVGIGPANSDQAATLHLFQQDNNNELRIESAGDKNQSISLGGNTRLGTAPFAYADVPYGFKIGRIGNSDFNNDLLVIDREEPLGTFKTRLFSMNKDGDLTLSKYKSCSMLTTDANGKFGCGSAPTSPWQRTIGLFSAPTSTYLSTGNNQVYVTSNVSDNRPTARIGIGTSTPQTALHVVNNGTNTLWSRANLTSASYGYLLLGQMNGPNLVFDTDSIMARNNNSATPLNLQQDGGNLLIGSGATPVRVGVNAGLPNYNLEVNGTAGKTGGGSWSNSSDLRLKNVSGPYQKGLKEIMRLKPIRYRYKPDNRRDLPTNQEFVGFAAQHVNPIFPEAVDKGEDGYLDFNMHAINVALVNAVQDQQKIIQDLEKRIETLEKSKK